MDIATTSLILKTDRPVLESGTFLRGYVGNKYRDQPLLHHHLEKSCLYKYPLVQYKILEGTPVICGFGEGSKILGKISSDFESLKLGSNTYSVIERRLTEKKQTLDCSIRQIKYAFATPWIALNEKNYGDYMKKGQGEKVLILQKVLVGNILSLSKAFGYVVLSELKTKTRLRPVSVIYKGVKMLGFLGEFQVNFKLPEYIGLGKGVSQGFGTIKSV